MNVSPGHLFPTPFAILLAAALSGCATLAGPRAEGTAGRCDPPAESLQSVPAREWTEEQGWRFASADAAARAYSDLLRGSSPWPDWYPQQEATLAVGTRFQMAVGAGQPVDRPGGFGTFDRIGSVAEVRSGLAVRTEWKPDVDRVVTYEVTQPLRVKIGPVGPQVDSRSCRLLAGRWSQVEMLVPPPERMDYLKVIDVRPIR